MSSSSGVDTDASMETVIQRIDARARRSENERWGDRARNPNLHQHPGQGSGQKSKRGPKQGHGGGGGGGRGRGPSGGQGHGGSDSNNRPLTFVDRLKMGQSWNGRDWPPPAECPFDSVATVVAINRIESSQSSNCVEVILSFQPPVATNRREECRAIYFPHSKSNKAWSVKQDQLRLDDQVHCKIVSGRRNDEAVYFANDATKVEHQAAAKSDANGRGGDARRQQPQRSRNDDRSGAGGGRYKRAGQGAANWSTPPTQTPPKPARKENYPNNNNNNRALDPAEWNWDDWGTLKAAPSSAAAANGPVVLPAQSIADIRNRAKNFYSKPAKFVKVATDDGYVGFEIEDGCRKSVARLILDKEVDFGVKGQVPVKSLGKDIAKDMYIGKKVTVDAYKDAGESKDIVIKALYVDEDEEDGGEADSAVASIMEEVLDRVLKPKQADVVVVSEPAAKPKPSPSRAANLPNLKLEPIAEETTAEATSSVAIAAECNGGPAVTGGETAAAVDQHEAAVHEILEQDAASNGVAAALDGGEPVGETSVTCEDVTKEVPQEQNGHEGVAEDTAENAAAKLLQDKESNGVADANEIPAALVDSLPADAAEEDCPKEEPKQSCGVETTASKALVQSLSGQEKDSFYDSGVGLIPEEPVQSGACQLEEDSLYDTVVEAEIFRVTHNASTQTEPGVFVTYKTFIDLGLML